MAEGKLYPARQMEHVKVIRSVEIDGRVYRVGFFVEDVVTEGGNLTIRPNAPVVDVNPEEPDPIFHTVRIPEEIVERIKEKLKVKATPLR